MLISSEVAITPLQLRGWGQGDIFYLYLALPGRFLPLYLTFSTSTDLVRTFTNLVSTSTDHFLAFSCPMRLWYYNLPGNTNKQITGMQERQSKMFLNYIALYLVQVQKFEHFSTCLGGAKIIKHFVSLLRFY